MVCNDGDRGGTTAVRPVHGAARVDGHDGVEEGRGCATIEAKINYFRPVQAGRLRAIARCTNLSRRTAYTEAEIRDDEGRLIAKATGTFMLTDSLQQSERA